MKVIYKYRLPFMEKAQVEMPEGAKIIRVDGLDGALWLWAVVDTDAHMVVREFELFKTGGEMPEGILDDYKYIGCGAIFVQMELMMYVFERVGYTPIESEDLPPPFDWREHSEKLTMYRPVGDDEVINTKKIT